MATSYGPAAILGVVLVIGLVTFAIRFSFIGLFGWIDEVPAGLQRALRYVPAAVLAALVLPSFVVVQADGAVAVDKLLAGGLATAVAWRTQDILATMVAGMVALWVVRLVL